MKLRGLQHVSTPIPDGRQAAVRRFYGGLLGLRELQIPSTLDQDGLVWYSAGDHLELHFFPGEPEHGSGRHFCLDVENLEEVRQLLDEAGRGPQDATPIHNRPRFFCRDPLGNLIEFTSIQGDYLAD